MTYRIVFTPEARDELARLNAYLAAAADAEIAARFTSGILEAIAALDQYPARGTPRDDLRPGLRTLAWRRRVTIAYVAEEAAVVIIGIFYGGRDVQGLLNAE